MLLFVDYFIYLSIILLLIILYIILFFCIYVYIYLHTLYHYILYFLSSTELPYSHVAGKHTATTASVYALTMSNNSPEYIQYVYILYVYILYGASARTHTDLQREQQFLPLHLHGAHILTLTGACNTNSIFTHAWTQIAKNVFLYYSS